jgi:hypothetical protein
LLREGLSDDGLFVDPSVTHHEKRLVVDGMIRQEEDSVKGGTEAPKSTVSGPRNSTILNPPPALMAGVKPPVENLIVPAIVTVSHCDIAIIESGIGKEILDADRNVVNGVDGDRGWVKNNASNCTIRRQRCLNI